MQRVSLLGLLSPLVATAVGWLVLDQAMTVGQLAGAALVLGALAIGQRADRPAPAPVPPLPVLEPAGRAVTA